MRAAFSFLLGAAWCSVGTEALVSGRLNHIAFWISPAFSLDHGRHKHSPTSSRRVSKWRSLMAATIHGAGAREAAMLKRPAAVQAKRPSPLRATHGPVNSADLILRRGHGATVCRE